MNIFLGITMHDKINVSIIDDSRNSIADLEYIKNDKSVINDIVNWLSKKVYKQFDYPISLEKIIIAVDARNDHAINFIYSLIMKLEYLPVIFFIPFEELLAYTKKTKKYRHTLNSRKVRANQLANFILENYQVKKAWAGYYYYNLRLITRELFHLKKKIANEKAHIISLCSKKYNRLIAEQSIKDRASVSKIDNKTLVNFMLHNWTIEELTDNNCIFDAKFYPENMSKEKIKKLGNIFRNAIDNSYETTSDTLKSVNFPLINAYLRFSLMQQQQTAMLRILEDYAHLLREDRHFIIIKSIPNISDYIALSVISEIGNISFFSSQNAFVNYSGLAPVEGKSKSNDYLRHAILFITKNLMKYNKPLREYCDKKSKEKPYPIALIATARKVAKMIYTLLSECRLYAATKQYQMLISKDMKMESSMVDIQKEFFDKINSISLIAEANKRIGKENE